MKYLSFQLSAIINFLVFITLFFFQFNIVKANSFNCDFYLYGYSDIEFDKSIKDLRLFNVAYVNASNSNLEVSDFNLSSNFIPNLNKVANILGATNEFGTLLGGLSTQIKDADITDINKALKEWIMPQFKSYSEVSMQDNFILVSTILENGVVLVTDADLNKISNQDFKNRDVIIFFINLADTRITFESTCS